MSEIWDAYDKNRHLIPGKTINRDTFSLADDYHLVVEVLLIHKDLSVLFMHRTANKQSFPDYYEATAGGAALQGETSEQAVKRELKEETNLEAEHLKLLYQTTEEQYHMHFDKYIGYTNADKDSVIYQKDETDGHLWVQPKDLAVFLKKEKVIPSQIIELKLIFGLKE